MATSLKLSKRLTQIEKMVSSKYTHIWDCCCDHGFLGAALLSRQAASTIHFVDIVPQLIAVLENKLTCFYGNPANSVATSSRWQTHCIDVTTLPLPQYAGNHLIIIAGVGADLMIKFIQAINQSHPSLTIDYLLCPVHHQFALRRTLIELKLSLKDEELIEDNDHFYEIILASSTSNKNNAVSPTGNKIWQAQSTKQADVIERYLNTTLSYYRRNQRGDPNSVDHIIEAYSKVLDGIRRPVV